MTVRGHICSWIDKTKRTECAAANKRFGELTNEAGAEEKLVFTLPCKEEENLS